MKTSFATALALLAPAVLASHQQRSHSNLAAKKRSQPVVREEIPTETCTEAIQNLGQYTTYEAACVNLIYDCVGKVDSSPQIWNEASCVAAATCDGTRNLLTLAQCQNSAVTSDYLNYDVYATIVGDCAWADGGCSVTQQNYIDFFYGTLDKIGSTEWPSDVSSVVENYWEPIKAWAQTGDDIPYYNFSDWLRYSDSYAEDVPGEDECEA